MFYIYGNLNFVPGRYDDVGVELPMETYLP